MKLIKTRFLESHSSKKRASAQTKHSADFGRKALDLEKNMLLLGKIQGLLDAFTGFSASCEGNNMQQLTTIHFHELVWDHAHNQRTEQATAGSWRFMPQYMGQLPSTKKNTTPAKLTLVTLFAMQSCNISKLM